MIRKAGWIFSILVILAVVMLAMMAACGPTSTPPPAYIAHTEKVQKRQPTTDDSREVATYYKSINCTPGETKCEKGQHYHICSSVEGNCGPCDDLTFCEDGTECWSGPEADCRTKSGGGPCHTTRVCKVSNLHFNPSDIVDLAKEITLKMAASEAMRCDPRWETPLGHRSGNFWLRIESRDNSCTFSTAPVE